MVAWDGTTRRLIFSVIAAVTLLTLPPGWQDVGSIAVGTVSAEACSRTGEVRATTCRLIVGEGLDDTLGAGEQAVYRLDALTADADLDLALTRAPGSTVSVLNWRGEELGSASHTADADTHLTMTLSLPGSYGVRVAASDPSAPLAFHIQATMDSSSAQAKVLWPMARDADDPDSLAGERQLLRTPRGGTPTGGVAIARALGAPPESEVGDFTLVSDVHFDAILGPSALTVRFRYEPEAGGGSGYLLTLDPFASEGYLDTFEEGRRHPLVPRTRLPVELGDAAPRRLTLQATGPDIVAALDGHEVLRATDTRYPRGLIAIGAVTWSDPVAVIFDHLLVLAPPN